MNEGRATERLQERINEAQEKETGDELWKKQHI